MATIFLSDVHLRLDRPERARRLARAAGGFDATDHVVVVGDLCDFWFASRQMRDGAACEGLRSLAEFRSRGGRLTLLPGNHDAWLGPYLEETLGVGYPGPDLDLTIGGRRFHAAHGHLVGAQSAWKGWMKSRAFLRAFRATPGPIARGLGALLDSANSVGREAVDLKHIGVYRRHADTLAGRADVCVYGHIHRVHDDVSRSPRVVVLGGWHRRSSYLRVDDDGRAEMRIVEDGAGPDR